MGVEVTFRLDNHGLLLKVCNVVIYILHKKSMQPTFFASLVSFC